MMITKRKKGEYVEISYSGNTIATIRILKIYNGIVKIGFDVSPEYRIIRGALTQKTGGLEKSFQVIK